MLPVERHRFITEVLSQRGRVMVQEVAQLCHISIETARRDLALLERRGLLLRRCPHWVARPRQLALEAHGQGTYGTLCF